MTVLGLNTMPLRAVYQDRPRMIGVRLTSAGAMRLLGPAVAQFVNGAGDGVEILGTLARRLTDAVEQLAESGNPDSLHRELTTALRNPAGLDLRVEQAASLLHARHLGTRSISTVAREIGISTRQLDRHFDRWFGISPKLLYRLARFRTAFAAGVMGPRGGWAGLAARCGYADQSHLCREFVEFGGGSPEQLRLSMAPAADD